MCIRDSDEIEINLGSLDDPGQLVPTYELWTCRRLSWLPAVPGLRGFETDRDPAARRED